MTTRRNVLTIIGGVGVTAAIGAGGFIATNGVSRSARLPWREAGAETEYRRRALSYALLAPNPHNRQPWLVKLEGEDALTLYCDNDRKLPETDPYDRQITIGCGAFLELMSMAAAEDGYNAKIIPFHDGEDMAKLDDRPVARVEFTKGTGAPDPLFAHVLDRRTNRERYEPKSVEDGLLRQLTEAAAKYGLKADYAADDELTAKLRDLTWRAHEREALTPAVHHESVNLFRIGAKEVKENPDGIALDGPIIAAGKLFGAVNTATLADPNSSAFRQGLTMFHERAMSAKAFAWISNDNKTRTDQLNAGRSYLRLNLQATALGLAIHPWSQALQEYSSMSDLYDEVHKMIAGGRTLQMLVRVGYARPVGPAPRWGLENMVV